MAAVGWWLLTMLVVLWHPWMLWNAAQAAKLPDARITAQERKTVIDGSLNQLSQLYVFPQVAAAMDAAVRASLARGDYDSINRGDDFAGRLTADLRAVSHDDHLLIEYYPTGVPTSTLGAARGSDPKPQALEPENYGFSGVQWLDGRVGYIEIREFGASAEAEATASAALSFVADADALIVDLRRNPYGGDPEGISYVLSYLFDQPTHVNDIHIRVGDRTVEYWTRAMVPGRRFGGHKPVYVLTSHDTFSGAEEFAYDLQALKRARVIGEATRGAAHMARPVPLGAHFVIRVPFAQALNPVTHRNWDDTGVIPDTAAPAAHALDVAYRLALQELISSAPDDRQKKRLRALLPVP
jgi:retinol-binding protein 3